MNTQLAKMLLLLTMTAGFVSASTIQETDLPKSDLQKALLLTMKEVATKYFPDANSPVLDSPLSATEVVQEETQGNKIRVIEIYSGEKIYNDILKDPRWNRTLLNIINNPRKVPENPGHWVYGKNWGDDKYVWNDDFIATVDQEKDGNVKFFEATSYFPEEFAKDANCSANKVAYDIWQNMTKLKTLNLDVYDKDNDLIKASSYLSQLESNLATMLELVRYIDDMTESRAELKTYDSLIKGIAKTDVEALRGKPHSELPGSTLLKELSLHASLFSALAPTSLVGEKECCICM